jgi:hypothetical protein
LARFVIEFQALDSLRLDQALDRHLQGEGRSLNVFVQVNTPGDASAHGLVPDDAAALGRRRSDAALLRALAPVA